MDIKVIGQEIKESILEHEHPNTTSCNSLLDIILHRMHVCYICGKRNSPSLAIDFMNDMSSNVTQNFQTLMLVILHSKTLYKEALFGSLFVHCFRSVWYRSQPRCMLYKHLVILSTPLTSSHVSLLFAVSLRRTMPPHRDGSTI